MDFSTNLTLMNMWRNLEFQAQADGDCITAAKYRDRADQLAWTLMLTGGIND